MQATLLSALILALSAGAAVAQTDVRPDIYPQAPAGQTRHILVLPQQPDESLVKVEIVAGTIMEVDCNRVMISGQLERRDVQGWGYPYFELKNISPPASTMMACPGMAKTNKLITLNLGTEALDRYNSKLPLVIYAPENLQIGYRVWKTDGQITGMPLPNQ